LFFSFQNEEWLDDCQSILNDIISQPGSDLLRYPIDENEYPVLKKKLFEFNFEKFCSLGL
jgi:hypothetical protein